MPLISMARIAADRAAPDARSRDSPSSPTANELLKTIGAYIPTDVTALYVPIAAGMVAAEAADNTKHDVAIGVAVLAAFTAWVVAQRAAVAASNAAGTQVPQHDLTALSSACSAPTRTCPGQSPCRHRSASTNHR